MKKKYLILVGSLILVFILIYFFFNLNEDYYDTKRKECKFYEGEKYYQECIETVEMMEEKGAKYEENFSCPEGYIGMQAACVGCDIAFCHKPAE